MCPYNEIIIYLSDRCMNYDTSVISVVPHGYESMSNQYYFNNNSCPSKDPSPHSLSPCDNSALNVDCKSDGNCNSNSNSNSSSEFESEQKIRNLKKSIESVLKLDTVRLPDDMKISTMTLEAKLNTRFYPWNIYKYINRSPSGILINDENRNKKNKKAKNKNKQSEVFLNQVTISIMVSKKTKPVSVKIFNSGTIHFTGCKCADDLLEAVEKLCIECRREMAIIKNGMVCDVKFAEDIDQLKVENLYDFKVDMINCIFVVPFKINRIELQKILKLNEFDATYDSNAHAGVRIKYESVKNKITIFVFESGSVIIILGNQGFSRINEVHLFVYKYLLENYTAIVKNDDVTKQIMQKYLEKEKEKEKEKKKEKEKEKGKNKCDR
jgi:TATA-box binding protein (TBP) (component of TFIID and TFIIIB)